MQLFRLLRNDQHRWNNELQERQRWDNTLEDDLEEAAVALNLNIYIFKTIKKILKREVLG